MAEARHELANYRDIIDTTERIKRRWNPLDSTEDKAEKDQLDDSTFDVYPGPKTEELEEPHNQCFFEPDFSNQMSLRSIFQRHGQVFLQLFD